MGAVLAEGRIARAGPPESVFRFPNSAFVAEFIGTGTVLRGVVERSGPIDPAGGKFAGLFRSGALVLEVAAEREGGTFAVLRPADLVLSRTPSAEPAPRNRFQGTVTRVERGSAVALIHLDVLGTALVAAVMTTTAEEMELRAGGSIMVGVKATAVHLI